MACPLIPGEWGHQYEHTNKAVKSTWWRNKGEGRYRGTARTVSPKGHWNTQVSWPQSLCSTTKWVTITSQIWYHIKFSKCDPKTSSISTTWEHARCANFQALLQTHWIRSSGGEPSSMFEQALWMSLTHAKGGEPLAQWAKSSNDEVGYIEFKSRPKDENVCDLKYWSSPG